MPKMTCEDCGVETEIIQRYIGFFGLQEVYSRWCREHITDHAAEAGMSEEDTLQMYDNLVEVVKAGQEQYQAGIVANMRNIRRRGGATLLVLMVLFMSPAWAFDGSWDDLRSGESADAWEGEYERQDHYGVDGYGPLVEPYLDVDPEPGHIPYNCGHIVGNARARADCQRDWEADNPNDRMRW